MVDVFEVDTETLKNDYPIDDGGSRSCAPDNNACDLLTLRETIAGFETGDDFDYGDFKAGGGLHIDSAGKISVLAVDWGTSGKDKVRACEFFNHD